MRGIIVVIFLVPVAAGGSILALFLFFLIIMKIDSCTNGPLKRERDAAYIADGSPEDVGRHGVFPREWLGTRQVKLLPAGIMVDLTVTDNSFTIVTCGGRMWMDNPSIIEQIGTFGTRLFIEGRMHYSDRNVTTYETYTLTNTELKCRD